LSDPHWTGYVGMVTGIVGALTGIAGSIMGYVGYKNSREIKSLDMRLELRKSIQSFRAVLEKTHELLPYANKSRERVASAIGKLRSGEMVLWKQTYESDYSALKGISEKAESLRNNYDDLSPSELESELININDLKIQLNLLKDKYDVFMQEDDRERERIKNRHEPR